MKPYVGIILDSFWEATSNRVFWALLIVSTLILTALAPFGLVVERNLSFSSVDIADQHRLITKLARGLDGRSSAALSAIAERLTPEFAEKVRAEVREKEPRVSPSELVGELNRIIEIPDLYSKDSYPTAEKRQRLVDLIRRMPNGLTAEEIKQLNRELLLITFTPEITTFRGEQVWVGYAGFKIGTPLAVTQRQIKTYVEPLMLQLVVQFGLGVMIVFVAIIVTSPIIPETFRAGNLYLLLSKPISRSWLFISKFTGGCIFVTLNLVYVLVGLYLIVGLRFGIWNSGLLACIPLLLFVYIVLYSVSALAGLIWGNAIVSVISVIIFWVFFFAVGTMHDILQMRVEQWSQLRSIDEVNGQILAVTEAGNLKAWDHEFSVWRPATEVSVRAEGMACLTFGPFEDSENDQFLAKTFMPRTIDLSLVRPSRSLTMIRWDDRPQPPQTREEARKMPVWNAHAGPEIPEQVFRIVQLHRQLVVVSRLGLYRLDLDRPDWRRPDDRAFFGLFQRSAFEEATPRGFRFSDNTSAIPQGRDGLLVYTDGSLTAMRLERGRFQIQAQTTLEGDGSEVALLAASDDRLAVAREGRPLQIFDSGLQLITQIELPVGEKPKQLGWIPNSQRLMILLHSGQLLVWDTTNTALERIRLPLRSRISSMNTRNPQHLWLGMIPDRAARIDWSDYSLLQLLDPAPTRSERFYYQIIRPLYRFNPKPSALNQSMHYLLTGERTFDPQLIPIKMDSAQVELEVWQPIISNLAFVFCMIAASCTYLSWKEF